MKLLIQLICTIFLLSQAFIINAQLIPIPLDYKFENSEVIIEGKVVEQKSYIDRGGEIYTENTIEVLSFIKGHIESPYLSVITMGGKTDKYEVTWTHLATLKLDQQGVFFLTKTKRPINERPENSFDLFSSSQGFYEVFKDDEGYKIISALERYDNPKEFYEKIGVRYSAINGGLVAYSLIDEPCLVFKIIVSPVSSSQSSVLLNADIYVKLNEGFKHLYKSDLVIKYSGDFFGQNIVAAGNLTFSGGELVTPSYDLSMTDYTNDKLEIKLDGLTTDISELEQLGTDFRHLVSMQINLIGWSGDTPIEWDSNNENVSNLYIEANTELIKAFDCAEVLLEEATIAAGGIDVISFSPNSAAGGIGNMSSANPNISGTVTITGSGFSSPASGETIPNGYYVKFKTVGGGWIAPLEGDYLSWSDTEIEVKVPSIGYDNNSDDIISNFNTDVACTGKIRVCKDGTIFNCIMNDDTDTDLYIPFSVQNTLHTNSDGNKEGVRTILLDFIDGGYKVYFHSNFITDGDAKNAFARALSTWRCATGVFFDISTNPFPGPGEGICLVKFASLPVGVGSVTRGKTSYTPINCGTEPNINYSYIKDYLIQFNDNINWHKNTSMPNNLNWNDLNLGTLQADLETTALHELGHAHLLNHTCNSTNVMISPGPNNFRRDLTIDDEDGGDHISILSYNYISSDCPDLGMSLLPLSECIISPVIEINREYIAITIYPNPVQEKAIINLESDIQLDGRIEILDNTGKVVVSLSVNSNVLLIDFSNLTSGVYHLIYRSENGTNSFLGNISKI